MDYFLNFEWIIFLNFHFTIFLLNFAGLFIFSISNLLFFSEFSIIYLSCAFWLDGVLPVIERVSAFIDCDDGIRVYRQGTRSLHFSIAFGTVVKSGTGWASIAAPEFLQRGRSRTPDPDGAHSVTLLGL
jgi:hypothetical protein